MGLRTGTAYLEGLKDGREVWIEGRRVTDVTEEPGFARTARAVAQYYDFQCADPDALTYVTDDGDRAHLSFVEPRTRDDLRRRGQAFSAWAEATGGSMARSPDYMNAMMMSFAAARKHWAIRDPALGQHARDAYLRCRREDLCLTHTFVAPKVDWSEGPESQAFRVASVVRRDGDVVVVRGARLVGTLAPFCDANVSFGLPLVTHPREADSALCFVHDVGMRGARWLCRDRMGRDAPFDAPMSTRVDEMDCTLILDDAEIPWNRFFGYRDARIHNQIFTFVRFEASAMHHAMMRFVARARLLFGVGHLLAETGRVGKFVNVQERLGDLLMCLQTLQALAIAAVEAAEQDPDNGLWYVHGPTASAAGRLHAELYPRMVQHLVQLGAGAYVTTPDEATLDALGEGIELYFKGAGVDARGRIALCRLAWDLCGSAAAGRTQLYERFFGGDTTQLKASAYRMYDKTEAVALVQRMLRPPTLEEPFAVPPR